MMLDSDLPEEHEFFRRANADRALDRFRIRQLVYTLLFCIGTIVAAIGWYAAWRDLVSPAFGVWLPLAGHVLQVIGAFGNLLTPDDIEEGDDIEEE